MIREECLKHGIDYDAGVHRLVDNEELYLRILKDFLNDTSYPELVKALEKDDCEAAFLAAHKLKGICGNLSLQQLYDKVCVLVEELRLQDMSHIDESFPPIKKVYEDNIDFIRNSL